MKNVLCVLAVIVAFCCQSPASERIRIEKVGGTKTSIDLAGLTIGAGSAQFFRKTLEDDLIRSGWFTVVDERGTVSVAGSCNDSGSSMTVQCDVRGNTSGERYLSKTYKGESIAARRMAHKLADEIVMAVKGMKGLASTQIIFVGGGGARKDLFICDADGGSLTQLTKDGTAARVSPSWAPGGDSIVYTSYRSGFPDVYRVDMATYERKRISSFPGLNSGASISPDGRRLALTLSKDGNPDIYIIDLQSGRLTRLTRTRDAAEASPSWSPDGKRIAFVSNATGMPHIYVMTESGGTAKRLTYHGNENVSPDWGSNGMIAFTSRREGRYQVWVVDPATSSEKAVAADDGNYEDPSWAPDGRHIVCSRMAGYHSALYVLDAMGEPPVLLTKSLGEWYSPSWSKE